MSFFTHSQKSSWLKRRKRILLQKLIFWIVGHRPLSLGSAKTGSGDVQGHGAGSVVTRGGGDLGWDKSLIKSSHWPGRGCHTLEFSSADPFRFCKFRWNDHELLQRGC